MIHCVGFSGFARFMSGVFSVLLLAGCVTTKSNEIKKWEDTERVDLHTQMAMNYLQQGQLETALEEAELALRIDPTSSRANLARAKLAVRLDDTEKARHHYSRAVRYNGNNVSARNDYGFFLCEIGETQEGLIQLTEALNNPLNRAQYITLFGAAECERKAGDMVKAVEYYDAVLNIQPDMRPALLALARANFAIGNHLKTRGFLERFFQNRTYSDESLFLAVRNELELDRHDLASNYARHLRTQFPRSQLVPELRSLFGSEEG